MSDIHLTTLKETFSEAEKFLQKNGNIPTIPPRMAKDIVDYIDLITDNVEYFLGINNVLLTSLVEKIVHPKQDIRLHQVKMDGGYSGRTLDTKYVTPFLKSKHLKSMVESGWLTRSLEQGYPYDLKYRGAIRNKQVKKAFLEVLDYIQNKQGNPRDCLNYYFQKMILFREKGKIEINALTGTAKLSISEICHLLEEHFTKCNTYGKAKLPVIAVYSVYECLIGELKRFEGKTLLPLGHHTSADYRSKAVGDIQVNDKNGEPFEGVEIKFKKPITQLLVNDAYEKIKRYRISRYYLLSTEDVSNEEIPAIQQSVNEIAEEHGCQVVVNGLINTIKYYLRLLENTSEFIKKYTQNIVNDSELKIEHKEMWKSLIEK